MHFGKRAQPAIAEARLQQQAAAELARLNVPPVDDHLAELARLAGQAIAWKDRMGEKVNELTSIRYQDAKGAEQLRAEIQLFERAIDRCASVLIGMARLDIDNRLIGVRERTVDMLVAALDAALNTLGLSWEDKIRARDTYREHIVVVPGWKQEPEPECSQAEFVEGEIRALEAKTTGWGDE